MNTYSKFVPNVFLAKYETQRRGEEITLTTKYGQRACLHRVCVNREEVLLLNCSCWLDLMFRNEPEWSWTVGYSNNAKRRGGNYRKALGEGKDFLSLGEPIKVGLIQNINRALIEQLEKNGFNCIKEHGKLKTIRKRLWILGKENRHNKPINAWKQILKTILNSSRQKPKLMKD